LKQSVEDRNYVETLLKEKLKEEKAKNEKLQKEVNFVANQKS